MNPVIVLTGATGSGKSSLVYSLQEELPIEIVCADSRQMYAELQIGTAGPSDEELRRFPHHLFYSLPLDQKYSAGRFVKDALAAINDIHGRKKIPLLIGGTFFYIKALWDGIAIEPVANPEVEQKVNALSDEALAEELRKADPVSHDRIHPSDKYRQRRALFFSWATGAPFSASKKTRGYYSEYEFDAFYLDVERETLYDRINRRVAQMFDAGLIQEAASAVQKGGRLAGLNSIGYKEIIDYCERESIPPEQFYEHSDKIREHTESLIARNTRRYAKRQLTWFRHEPRLKKIDYASGVSQISESIIRRSERGATPA